MCLTLIASPPASVRPTCPLRAETRRANKSTRSTKCEMQRMSCKCLAAQFSPQFSCITNEVNRIDWAQVGGEKFSEAAARRRLAERCLRTFYANPIYSNCRQRNVIAAAEILIESGGRAGECRCCRQAKLKSKHFSLSPSRSDCRRLGRQSLQSDGDQYCFSAPSGDGR